MNAALSKAKLQGKNHLYVYEEAHHPEQTEKAQILIVDDDPVNVQILGAILAASGYEALNAFNGEEAIRLIERGTRIWSCWMS